MNTPNETQTDSEKRKVTNANISGTNPDRYASYHTVAEAEQLSQNSNNQSCSSLISGLTANVGTLERMLMVTAGGYLLYNALSGAKKNVPQTIAATTMLARGISGYCPIYNALGKVDTPKSSNVNIRTSINIDKPVDEVYNFWRNLENLPKFMSHLKSVEEKNATHSYWVAQGPAGIGSLSWEAKILMDDTGRQLSWQSLPGSTIDNAGKVRFKQRGSSGTELDVTISYHAPLGTAGEAAAQLLNPLFERMVKNDIESLKDYLETGSTGKV
jgi:uncharacterized membrane protein